ncbi:MAG: hypothetical protein M2R45_02589 [Verrucomicrobia subdivision 3 bacterium]|nr:hypothetical protein [Limisphaerales bacterium]MCS1416441.1 hypothetical protein [Limisphaerales bacterium]
MKPVEHTESLDAYEASVAAYREFFRSEVIGIFDDPLLPFNVRTRLAYEEPKWVGYEVMLDVFPEVIAYGILCLSRDIKPDERHLVVVC